jgi:hypothetical protein
LSKTLDAGTLSPDGGFVTGERGASERTSRDWHSFLLIKLSATISTSDGGARRPPWRGGARTIFVTGRSPRHRENARLTNLARMVAMLMNVGADDSAG